MALTTAHRPLLATLLHILILGCSVVWRPTSACDFPDYVQSGGLNSTYARDWKGKILDQNQYPTLKYLFNKDLLEVISSEDDVLPYSRVCIQVYDSNKFLVAHEEKGQTRAIFTCMQLIMRDSTVLQIRQSPLSTSMSGDQCADSQLELDPWIVVDVKAVAGQRQQCPLTGGFNMVSYDKSNFVSMCDTYTGETRLESDCLAGEGLVFVYRYVSCIPEGLVMYVKQRTFCLTNWVEGGYRFTLIRHDTMPFMWLLRYKDSKGVGDTFMAILFKDLQAVMQTEVTTTYNYIILTLTSPTPKLLDSLCYDDYEICSTLRDPCNYSEQVARMCAKTCGFCSETRPTLCKFPLAVNGTWVDARRPEAGAAVQINATSIEMDGEVLHCVDWPSAKRKSRGLLEDPTEESPVVSHGSKIPQQMMVTVNNNGCRPRFTCGRFIPLPSNALFLQLSQRKLYPLVQNADDEYSCNDFVYASDTSISTNPYRSRHVSLFITDNSNASARCDLSDFRYFNILFKGGQRCDGRLAQNGDKETIQMNFVQCPVQRLRHKFSCVEYSSFPPESDKLLVTRSHEASPKVHCWLFPKKPNNMFHIIDAEQCNDVMKRKLKRGRLRPIATVTIDPTKVDVESSTNEVQTDASSLDDTNQTLIIIEALETVAANNPVTSTVASIGKQSKPTTTKKSDTSSDGNFTVKSTASDVNLTREYQEEGRSDTSPVLVAAIIAVVIVLQLPLLLKCKCL